MRLMSRNKSRRVNRRTYVPGGAVMKHSLFFSVVLAFVGALFWSRPTWSEELTSTSGTTTRYEETDPAIVYSTTGWLPETTMAWSGGKAMYTASTGAQATFTFTGTGVSWIGYRGRYGGIVRVSVDGAVVTELDTYSATEQVSVAVYTVTGLAPGSHRLTVELTAA